MLFNPGFLIFIERVLDYVGISGCAKRRLGWTSLPRSQKSQKFSKKNNMKLVGYTLRVQNDRSKSPPTSFRFSRAGAATCWNLTVCTFGLLFAPASEGSCQEKSQE